MIGFLLKSFPESKKYPNTDKTYPIHKACLGGDVNVLREFYNNFPKSVSIVDRQGQTVLHLAAKERGNKLKEVVIYLLSLPEGKKLINMKDENGNVPLDLAKSSNNHEVERVIIGI
jgi:ankyrin repeat protein